MKKIVDSLETLEEKIKEVQKAQEVFATYTQEQVDKIFKAAAIAANSNRIMLAKMAVEETGMGVVEDKVIKNHYASEYIYNAYRDTQTCGVIEEDTAFGIKKVAEPIGVIAAVIPTTNPTSTAIFKTLIALKTRNGIIISPHPRAKKSTIAAAKVVLDAAIKAGAPQDIIGWIDVPSLEMTNMVMKAADIILATGGPGMVKAAYSSGKPALGVGSGNTPAIIDESANVVLAVNSIIHSKTFDNGMICASEQSVIVLNKVYEQVKDEFIKRGCYFLNPEELEKVRKTILINGSLNAKIVGQTAYKIAQLSGIEVPTYTKILIGEVEKYDLSEAFTTIAHESYPGHLYQNCYFQSLNPAPIRSVISVGGYTEGWGTYAELYSYSIAGIDKDVAKLMVQNTIATLCVYGKADIGVNYMGWDFNKLQSYLADYGFSKSQSRTVFDSMVAEPANYLQYTLGYLEIEDLKNEAKRKLGDKFKLADFHKFFLSIGPAPFSVIENYLDEWIQEMQKDSI